jgi:hypothetical protein
MDVNRHMNTKTYYNGESKSFKDKGILCQYCASNGFEIKLLNRHSIAGLRHLKLFQVRLVALLPSRFGSNAQIGNTALEPYNEIHQ